MTRPRSRAAREALGADLLRRLRESDDDEDTTEAEAAGCRKVLPVGDRWGLFRTWDEPEEGDSPVALFTERPAALLAAAVWEAYARAPLVELDPTVTPEGFPLRPASRPDLAVDAVPLGWLPAFDPHLVLSIDLASALVRDPEALAALLEAAGVEAVEQTIRIFRRRLQGRLSE